MIVILTLAVAAGLILGAVAVKGQRANRRAGITAKHRQHSNRDAASDALRGYYAGRAIGNNRVPQYLIRSAAWRAYRRWR
jgi:hypothetical protein